MSNTPLKRPRLWGESNAVLLRAGDWLVVALIMAGVAWGLPRAWSRYEGFAPETDYRVPYALSEDYWHFTRYARLAARDADVLVVGDSVVWGEFTPPHETLTHHLSALEDISLRNLGVNGIHPVALDGLLRYYGRPVREKPVLLHFNPLWMSSPRHDLSADREFRFNHPALVPQFWPRIPCYHDDTGARADIVASRFMPLRGFAAHLAIAYYDSRTPPLWATVNPYDSLVRPLFSGLPEPGTSHNEDGRTWTERGMTPQPFEWVAPEESLQWRFFKESAQRLRRRGNNVFVLVGPFNVHAVDASAQEGYQRILDSARDWLTQEDFAHYIAPPLPSDLYADASHPLGAGYAQLARELRAQEGFRAFIDNATAATTVK